MKKKIISAVTLITILGAGYFGLSNTQINDLVKSLESFMVTDYETEVPIEEHEAEIVRVVDGDTIVVNTKDGVEERVRLLLIDTPESVHPTEPEQLFGKESSDYAKEILREGDVVELEVGESPRDRYGRLLAYVWIDGVNFNQLMIERGYARVAYVYEPNTKYLEEFKEAEEVAKKNKLNIWSIEGYVKDDGFDMSVVD